MAKLPTKQQVNVRLPVDLVEWVATQSGSQTDVITAALLNLRDGPVIVDEASANQLATALRRAETAEARVTKLQADLLVWQSVTSEVFERDLLAAGPASSRARATKTGKHHAAGPVLASAVPQSLAGEAVGYRPKAGWKGDK